MTAVIHREHRALRWLHLYGRRYPWAWETYAQLLADPPSEWPSWCWCPLAGAYAVLSRGSDVPLTTAQATDVGALGGLAAWRATQGIYRVHPTLLAELLDTPVSGDLPSDVLTRLPAWCVYVETPGHDYLGAPLHGYWAYLEHDSHDGRAELRILLDLQEPAPHGHLWSLIVHLGGTIEDGLRAVVRDARIQALRQGRPEDAPSIEQVDLGIEAQATGRLVSVLLYLCADDAEVADRTPMPERVVRGKKRPLLPSAKAPTIHPCGYRIGAALELSRSRERSVGSEGAGASVTPHLRRAHWHRFWAGPRDGQRSVRIRWLSPILVGADGVPDVATVIPVRD